MTAAKPFLLGCVVAAAAAAGGWFLLVAPHLRDLDSRVAAAEESSRRARRESSDAQQWAETERDRNRTLEDKVKELEGKLADTVAAAGRKRGTDGAGGHGGHEGGPMTPPDETKPEDWDRNRLNQEIENLALAPDVIERSARFPLIVRSLKSRGAEGIDLVLQMVKAGFDAPLMAMSATLADAMGDARAVPPLLERWKKETDPTCRRAILRALSNLPGDEAIGACLDAWHDPAGDVALRRIAIHGLGLRGHEVARATAAAPGTGEGKERLRVRAIESLRVYAQRGGWTDTTLVPVFSKALRTADGPAQRKLSLIALEGLWSKDAIPDLEVFAADAGSPEELAGRARRLVEAVRSGAPRPEGAGVPERGLSGEAEK